jgi:outer membrane protein OmpA-like peptidoglycan-associated protein
MPGFYIAGQGTYWVNSWKDDFREFSGDSQGGTDNGWKAWGTLGYRFNSPWDIGISGGFSKLNQGDAAGEFNDRLKAHWWNVDGVVGYTMMDPGGFSWRPYFGVRYLNFKHEFRDNVAPIDSGDIKYWGVGPRLGIDAAYRFGSSGFFILGGIGGAVTWGKIKESGTLAHENESRVAYSLDGQIGLGYEFSPGLALSAGVQAEHYFHVNFTTAEDASGKGNRGAWGPFVRLAYNFGVPGQVTPIIAPIVAPAVDTRRFVVFFDWDRSNITPQAASTIRQAADTYRAGNSSRISATGHTDRSGSDQYNMGLSLRRANAVKDELIRDGVPAANIVVIGKGETMPLVQTADGVREPQNRRVEIVIE